MPHWGMAGLKPRDIDAVTLYIERVLRGTLRMPFQPHGLEVLTRFTHGSDSPAPL